MELTNTNLTEISLRLLNSGRYVWNITSQCATKDYEETINTIKEINTKLKDTFPDHASRGSSYVKDVDED